MNAVFATFYRPLGPSWGRYRVLHPQFTNCTVATPGCCIGHAAGCGCGTCVAATYRWITQRNGIKS